MLATTQKQQNVWGEFSCVLAINNSLSRSCAIMSAWKNIKYYKEAAIRVNKFRGGHLMCVGHNAEEAISVIVTHGGMRVL